jgi:GntR family transcriptional regulator
MDINSSVPIYLQLKNYLKDKIVNKVYLPGDLLPSEKELAGRFNISRMTVRQAIATLQHEGLIFREKGRGTFVARNIIEKQVELLSFSQDMKNRKMEPGSKVIDYLQIDPDASIREKLQLEEKEQVYLLKRLRLADHIPMAIEYCYLPCRLFPGLLKYNMETCSLYEIIQSDFYFKFSFARQVLAATKLARDDASLLLIKGPGFVLMASRTLYSDNNTALEYTETLYHPERYQYTMTLHKAPEV